MAWPKKKNQLKQLTTISSYGCTTFDISKLLLLGIFLFPNARNYIAMNTFLANSLPTFLISRYDLFLEVDYTNYCHILKFLIPIKNIDVFALSVLQKVGLIYTSTSNAQACPLSSVAFKFSLFLTCVNPMC